MTTHYCKFVVDVSGDNYKVPSSDLLTSKVVRVVSNPSSFEFVLHNPDGNLNDLYEMDDKIDVHMGTEDLRDRTSVSALSFDGIDDYVNAPKIATPSAFSMFCWFKRLGNSGGSANDAVHNLVNAVNGNSQNRLVVNKDGLTAQAVVYTDGVIKAASKSITNIERWHHLGAIWDGDYLYCSVDGVLSAGTAASGTLASGVSLTSIGRFSLNWYYANGIIDEVRIFNRALDASEVLDAYNGSPSATGLVAYWDFNEGGGSVAIDRSTNTNNGTITGATWVNPKIMTGLLEETENERPEYGKSILVVRGQDYLSVLAYRLARVVSPGIVNIGSILSNVVTEYAPGEYTTTNISGGVYTQTDFTVGVRTSILNVMRKLADLPTGDSFDFYLDGNNGIHWHLRGDAAYDSGVTLTGDDLRSLVVRKSVKDKKTVIHVQGARTPVEETTSTQLVVTDSVTLETNHYADDFIAEHDYLMRIKIYIQKVGTPGADLSGRVATARLGGPFGDFKAFTIREEEISTDADWYTIPIDLDTIVGTRYFIKLDKVGANSSNTYKWYGDSPAVIDTDNKALLSTNALLWTESDMDFSMKIYYGKYVEVSASSTSGPKREAVVRLPRAVDEDTAQALADRLQEIYLATSWYASFTTDAPSVELKPGDLITINEAGSGLASKAYRIERVAWEFGVRGKAEQVTIDVSALLPYESLTELSSKILEELLGATSSQLTSGDEEGAVPDRVGKSTISRSLVGYEM